MNRPLPSFPPQRILVAVDFGSPSLDAWACATDLGRRLQAWVEAIHVADARAAQDPRLGLEEELRRRLGADARVSVVAGEPEERILAEAAARDADMIVMGARGLSGFERELFG